MNFLIFYRGFLYQKWPIFDQKNSKNSFLVKILKNDFFNNRSVQNLHFIMFSIFPTCFDMYDILKKSLMNLNLTRIIGHFGLFLVSTGFGMSYHEEFLQFYPRKVTSFWIFFIYIILLQNDYFRSYRQSKSHQKTWFWAQICPKFLLPG